MSKPRRVDKINTEQIELEDEDQTSDVNFRKEYWDPYIRRFVC